MKHQELRFRGIKLKDLGAMQSYLTEHAKKNPDVDLSLSYMNHAIENLIPEQLESRVTDRIAQLHLKKRPRWDSIGIEDILVSPSEEFMDKVELCFREQYFQDSLHFFQSRYGKENVMYCQCHMDEREPHIHVVIVPITSEGQLSATKLFTYQEIKLMESEFHKDVAEGYTLKCAEHYLNEYLEAHSAKVDQLTLKLKIVSNNIGDAEEKQKELDRISKTVKTFIGEDNVEYSELATSDYRVLSYGETEADAIERYKSQDRHQEKAPRTKKNPFKVYSWKYGSHYFIGCKVGKEYVEIQSPFEKPEEAFAYLNSHMEELEEKLEKYRDIPYEREAQNTPRTGKLKRTGDVTPEQFQETFGFRGVEFGTWVENATRQENLNNAYDALTDMAEALNLPPRALSLNGSLGLAFGARGRGGKNAPLAHYEPVKVVINLTKNKGSGSLGHEWMHSFDNYFGRKEREKSTAMISHCVNQFEMENVSSEIMEGFKLVSKVINQSGLAERCKNLDKRREKNCYIMIKSIVNSI